MAARDCDLVDGDGLIIRVRGPSVTAVLRFTSPVKGSRREWAWAGSGARAWQPPENRSPRSATRPRTRKREGAKARANAVGGPLAQRHRCARVGTLTT
jgi:hypothetical protein